MAFLSVGAVGVQAAGPEARRVEQRPLLHRRSGNRTGVEALNREVKYMWDVLSTYVWDVLSFFFGHASTYVGCAKGLDLVAAVYPRSRWPPSHFDMSNSARSYFGSAEIFRP